jgi:hypothetical protein
MTNSLYGFRDYFLRITHRNVLEMYDGTKVSTDISLFLVCGRSMLVSCGLYIFEFI